MKITYKDMSEDLDAVIEAQKRDPLERYSIELEGDLKAVPALRVLSVMEETSSFEQRSAFVLELLQGCKVTVFKDGKKAFDVGVTQGTQWWAVDGFNADPMALRFLVTCVYTKFLKKYVA